MSPPDYDANLVPAPSLTREFEAIPGYHETQVRAAFKARYFKAVEEIVKDIAPTDFRCLFVSTNENFSVRTNQRGSNIQGGTRTVAGAVAGINTQMGSSPHLQIVQLTRASRFIQQFQSIPFMCTRFVKAHIRKDCA